MNLVTAAIELEVSRGHLRHLIQDAQRSADQRKYAAWQHEYYMTEHFVRDTKGKKNVTRGNFPYHIEDWRVEEWKRRRTLRLVSATPARLRGDTYAQLRALGIDTEPRRRRRI